MSDTTLFTTTLGKADYRLQVILLVYFSCFYVDLVVFCGLVIFQGTDKRFRLGVDRFCVGDTGADAWW
jgi:hypothetical protein